MDRRSDSVLPFLSQAAEKWSDTSDSATGCERVDVKCTCEVRGQRDCVTSDRGDGITARFLAVLWDERLGVSGLGVCWQLC